MRIAQIVMAGASEYERKSQRIDAAALAERHEVLMVDASEAWRTAADIVHVYASGPLPRLSLAAVVGRCVSSADIEQSRWSFRRVTPPAAIVSPVATSLDDRTHLVPEAVEDRYFTSGAAPRHGGGTSTIGSFARATTMNAVEQTLARIHRFREDVVWRLFDSAPEPEELASVDVWVDPAVREDDFDGFVAEALVSGTAVVAARTPINVLRLEKGRTGTLVPPGDPNEMTHAILAALFKPEVAESKRAAAKQTAAKYRPRNRRRVLLQLYELLAK